MELIVDTTAIVAFLERLGRTEFIYQLNSMYGKILVPAAVAAEIRAGNQKLIDKHIADGTMVITNLVTPEDLEYFWSRHRDMGPGETEVIVT